MTTMTTTLWLILLSVAVAVMASVMVFDRIQQARGVIEFALDELSPEGHVYRREPLDTSVWDAAMPHIADVARPARGRTEFTRDIDQALDIVRERDRRGFTPPNSNRTA